MEEFKMYNGEMLTVGEEIRFADLWQSEDGDLDELLESGCCWIGNDEDDDPVNADFEIVDFCEEEPVKTLVKIIGIF